MKKTTEINKEGGFSPARRVNYRDCEVFRRAMQNGPIGCVYTPLTVMTQVVAGTIYYFGTQEDIISEGHSTRGIATVVVFEDLACNGGGISIVRIESSNRNPIINSIDCSELYGDLFDNTIKNLHTVPMPGGYTDPHEPDEHDKAIFERAITTTLIGAKFEAYEVATQVVAGINYRFSCNVEAVYPKAEKYEAYVYVFEALPCYGGKVEVTRIERI